MLRYPDREVGFTDCDMTGRYSPADWPEAAAQEVLHVWVSSFQ